MSGAVPIHRGRGTFSYRVAVTDLVVPRLGLTKRTAAASRADEAEQALGRFVRLESWGGMAAGDVVKVAGHTARGRHWRFRAHVTNTSNGASWVEVSLVEGPAPARRPLPEADAEPLRVERVRSFASDLVTPRWRRRARRAARSAGREVDPPLQQSLF